MSDDPGGLPANPGREVLLVVGFQGEKHEIALGIDSKKVDESVGTGAQVGIEDSKPLLDHPRLLQDEPLDAFGISGGTPDDADGQPHSARKTASLRVRGCNPQTNRDD